MPAETNFHTTVRFFELSETVSRTVDESEKVLLLPLLKNIKNQAEQAGYQVPNSGYKTYAQFRYDQLLEVGITVEGLDKSNLGDATNSPTKKSAVAKTMTYTKRSEKDVIRCAHQRYTSPDSFATKSSTEETVTAAEIEKCAKERAHKFQLVFNDSFKQFVGKYKQQHDPELIPDGSFYVVFSDSINFSDADFYCALANEPPPVPIILDHDGGVDDLIALLVLASATVKPLAGMARRVELIGTTIVDADCFAKPTGELCRRLFCMFGRVSKGIANLPVGVSPLQGTAFPFPSEWRKDCLAMLDFPCLHTDAVDEAMAERPQEIDGSGHELLAKLVMSSPRPVTIVVTGPLTNVAFCLDKYGEAFAKNIREVSIMGGAVHVAGNVINHDLPKHAHAVDKSAEWNIYWDAPAAKTVLESPLIKNKLLYSLDATNHVPVTPKFVHRFGKVVDKATRTPTQLAVFCGNSWAMTTFLGFMFGEERGYFAWDVLSAVGVLVPTISKYETVKLVVDAEANSASEGRTKPDSEKGFPAYVALTIDAEAFYNIVLESAALF